MWHRLSTPKKAEPDAEYRLRYSATDILYIAKTSSLRNVIRSQYLKHIGHVQHVCRCPNTLLIKKMLLANAKRPYQRTPWINITKLLNVSIEQAKRSMQDKSGFTALVDRVVANAIPW